MPTNILAIETSTECCSVALSSDGEVIEKHQLAPKEHAYLILPFVESLLAEADIRLSQLDAIAFGRGPGAFTGLRISAGMVQGLALGQDIPIIPVSSLAALAQQAFQKFQLPRIIAVLDARMGELYWGTFSLSTNDANLLDSSLENLTIPEAILIDENDPYFYIGPGCKHLGGVLNLNETLNCAHVDQDKVDEENLETIGLNQFCTYYPMAKDILTIGLDLFSKGEVLDAEDALPVYLRNNVAAKPSKPKK